MPRRFIKRYMPDESKIKAHPHLQWLGNSIHNPNLWHLNRSSVSRAFLVGIFCAFLPIPFQMLVAAVLAIIIHSNLPISIGLVWITNPLTIPPIFYSTYKIGAFLLSLPVQETEMALSLEWLESSISHIWWPLLFGSLVCGILLAAVSYALVQMLWVWRVNRDWEARRMRRHAKSRRLKKTNAAQRTDEKPTDPH